MVLSDEYTNRLRAIIEGLSDEQLANEWKGLILMEHIYLGENPSERVLVDEISVVLNIAVNECARRFCNQVSPEAASAGTH